MKYLYILLITSVLVACGSETVEKSGSAQQKVVNTHLNILVAPDLSNRIEADKYPKAIADTTLIAGLYNAYYPALYKAKKRITGQKDELQLFCVNPKIIADAQINIENTHINLADMNDAERIEYLTKSGYQIDKAKATKEYQKMYNKALETTTGGDVYNFLKTEINNSVLKKDTDPVTFDGKEIVHEYKNIIVLLTDGYVEAGLYGKQNCVGKKCYFLTQPKINEFREAYKASGSTDMKGFFKQSGFGIIPVNNPALHNVEIIVTELYDRSLNRKTGSQTKTPNDLEIIKLFWEDWLTQSGVKRFELFKTADSQQKFVENTIQFIEKD